MTSMYEEGLDKGPANYAALSPMSFLPRAAGIWPTKPSVIHGDRVYTWAESWRRCRALARALQARRIGKGDTVAALAPNIPALWEAHFGVPMTGAVLNAMNTRLDAATIAYILDHGEAKLVMVDREFSSLMAEALSRLDNPPPVIDIDDHLAPDGDLIGETTYEAMLEAVGEPAPMLVDDILPGDEWDAISLNYTSGTTGNPKGVVYHHRGAFLNAVGNIMTWDIQIPPVYLWTLPMFHCNGWCFPWTIAAMGGTNVCLRRVESEGIFGAIRDHGVTHLCGAPIVINMLLNATDTQKTAMHGLDRTVQFMTAAAPPPPAVLEAIEREGFRITHVYGLTEVYGPAVVCEWHEDWNSLPEVEQAALKARQGVRYPQLEGLMIADSDSMEPVPRDGATMGEVFMRGNIVMKGYLKDEAATETALKGGWFRTGDLGVWHPDGYIELKDRAKDIIISGGENISTVEIENTLYSHPKVLEASVVARPDEKWGETPCAFITLRDGQTATAEEIIAYCRDNMAHFKCPKTVVFGALPKTSTGKVQKFVLREQARAL